MTSGFAFVTLFAGRSCKRCKTSLAKHKRPPFSIAAGWDLGDPARAGLPELSFCDNLFVQRVRVLHAAMNIRLGRQTATYNTTRGHGTASQIKF